MHHYGLLGYLTSREDQSELLSHLDDKKSTKRGDEEEAEERTDQGDSEYPSNIMDWQAAHQVKLVHGWQSRDEETSDTTGSGSSGLDDGVLLWTKGTAEDRHVTCGPGEELDKTVPENGTEHACAEGETSFKACDC